MDNIKSAEEILKEHITSIPTFYGVTEDSISPENALKAMQEYAAQFQPKWIEGVPEHSNVVMCLLSNGDEKEGERRQSAFGEAYDYWITPDGDRLINNLDDKVIAYYEKAKRPPIPPHLQALIFNHLKARQ